MKKKLKVYTRNEFIKLLKKNGYKYDHTSGDHLIYKNKNNRHISLPYAKKEVNRFLSKDLILKYNLVV